MTSNQANKLIELLTEYGVTFEKGLSNFEVWQIEKKFNFVYPPDFKLFLQTALPVSDSFVNWRLGMNSKIEEENIFSRLNSPLDGMLFDVIENNFWYEDWGKIPEKDDDKLKIAKKHYLSYPKLIPIYAHRFIPCSPNEEGNPVFSVHQMDIIYYGYDLSTYFANEFHFALTSDFDIPDNPLKLIEFWSEWT